MRNLPRRAVFVLLIVPWLSACWRQLADSSQGGLGLSRGAAVTRIRVIALVAIATLTVLVVAIVARPGGSTMDGAIRQGELDGGRRVTVIAPSPTVVPWAASVLAAVVPDGRGRSIALLDVDGKLPARRLTEGFDAVEAPAWSPDGSVLAFAGHQNGNWDLYLIARDGTDLRHVTDNTAFDGWPAWSPTGRDMVFVSSREGTMAVYRLAVDTGEPSVTRLSGTEGPAIEPAWSPDGRWITYAAWRDGAYGLEAVDAGGGTPHLVASPSADSDLRAPAWSPDGLRLSYLEQRYGSGQLIFRGWSAVQGEVRGLGRTVATQVAAYAWFPGGDAVALIVAGRSGREVEISSAVDYARWPVAQLPAAPTQVSWARGPAPAGLASLTIVRNPTPMAADVAARPGVARLLDVSAPGDRINAGLLADFEALRSAVRRDTGRDFLGTLADAWRPLGFKSTGSAFFSWHKTGRAFDTQMELHGPGGRHDMVLVREEVRGRTMWRMFLRAAAQDGSVGRPLVEAAWTFAAGSGDDTYAQAGGRRGDAPPGGYWVDFTDLATRYGWQRITSLTQGSVDWRRDWEGIEYWHYERRDGLTWFQAVQQLYSDEDMVVELAPDRLRELNVPVNRLARQGFPVGWPDES